MYKIACKIFLLRNVSKAIPAALTQSLKDWDWRPYCIRKEFISKLYYRVQKLSAAKMCESDSHGAHRDP